MAGKQVVQAQDENVMRNLLQLEDDVKIPQRILDAYFKFRSRRHRCIGGVLGVDAMLIMLYSCNAWDNNGETSKEPEEETIIKEVEQAESPPGVAMDVGTPMVGGRKYFYQHRGQWLLGEFRELGPGPGQVQFLADDKRKKPHVVMRSDVRLTA